jgi:protein TonB
MFEQSLVESTSLLRAQHCWPALAAFGLQVVFVAALLAIPLLHPEVLPFRALGPSLLASPPHPPQPPPRSLRVESTTAPTASSPTLPARIPDAFTSTSSPVDAPPLAIGLNLGPALPNLPTALLGAAPVEPRLATSPVAVHPSSPTTISTGVSSGLLLTPIRPDYPNLARLTRIEGTVVVQAIISPAGRIASAHIVRVPPYCERPHSGPSVTPVTARICSTTSPSKSKRPSASRFG